MSITLSIPELEEAGFLCTAALVPDVDTHHNHLCNSCRDALANMSTILKGPVKERNAVTSTTLVLMGSGRQVFEA
jgi:hypothetical protein